MEAEIEQVRSVLGPEPLESDILRALSLAGNNPNRAINIILDTPGFLTPRPPPVKLSTVGSGSRISASVKQEQLEEGDISNGQPEKVLDRRIQVVDLKDVENGEFPEERDWFLLGRTTVTGMSTCKGRKLEFNEIVHFAFPSADGRTSYRKPWVSAKAAAASLEIVRFSTKRNGEWTFN
ncbi:hypothetical protein QJS10_CPB18g01636 [Acorus calamus]|uniref:DNA repair protein RAD5A UBA domain-containing protein n=1 Tax=Acorus calamus TaxID=4465 RepID=A0AAV9CNC4_ACOCL|nr:hypothetical protein QJS10_CPB18g01636 [Acorus calamus]